MAKAAGIVCWEGWSKVLRVDKGLGMPRPCVVKGQDEWTGIASAFSGMLWKRCAFLYIFICLYIFMLLIMRIGCVAKPPLNLKLCYSSWHC